MQFKSLSLLAIVCITDIYADIDINLQNTSSQQVVNEGNLSTIEPAQDGDINNLFDSNSNTSLENFLDVLGQNTNNIVNNETNVNNDVSALNNGFIQTTNFQHTGGAIHDVHQQGQPLSIDVCHELQLDFRAGHTYTQTIASTNSSYVKNITSHAD